MHIRNTIGSGWVSGVRSLLMDTATTTTSKFDATEKGGRFCCSEVSGQGEEGSQVRVESWIQHDGQLKESPL